VGPQVGEKTSLDPFTIVGFILRSSGVEPMKNKKNASSIPPNSSSESISYRIGVRVCVQAGIREGRVVVESIQPLQNLGSVVAKFSPSISTAHFGLKKIANTFSPANTFPQMKQKKEEESNKRGGMMVEYEPLDLRVE
jgi:hypothetical protein